MKTIINWWSKPNSANPKSPPNDRMTSSKRMPSSLTDRLSWTCDSETKKCLTPSRIMQIWLKTVEIAPKARKKLGVWGGTKDMDTPPRGGGVQAKISGIKNIRKKFSGIKVYAGRRVTVSWSWWWDPKYQSDLIKNPSEIDRKMCKRYSVQNPFSRWGLPKCSGGLRNIVTSLCAQVTGVLNRWDQLDCLERLFSRVMVPNPSFTNKWISPFCWSRGGRCENLF